MGTDSVIVLGTLVFVVAVLYAAVGQGGGSGYLAVMALLGVAPPKMRPAALVLNVLVAGTRAVKLYRAGRGPWSTFWPFAALSVPCALLGGALTLPEALYRPLVGLALLYVAYRLLRQSGGAAPIGGAAAPRVVALAAGAVIGLLSGLTGVGGGIFLSPLLVLAGWADIRTAAGVSAAFILVNSGAGLLGQALQGAGLPPFLPVLAVAAVAGGWIGAELGSRRLPAPAIQRLLGVVLTVAGLKMLVV